MGEIRKLGRNDRKVEKTKTQACAWFEVGGNSEGQGVGSGDRREGGKLLIQHSRGRVHLRRGSRL